MSPRSPVIAFTIGMHFALGFVLIFSPSASSTPYVFELFRHVYGYAGSVFIGVAILALVGLLKFHGTTLGLILKLPQQFVMILGLVGSINSVSSGTNAFGQHYPRALLLTSFLPGITLALCHFWVLLQLYRGTHAKG